MINIGIEVENIDWEKIRQVLKERAGSWAEKVWIRKGKPFTKKEARRRFMIGVHNYDSLGYGMQTYGWLPLDGDYNVIDCPVLTKTGDGQYWTDKSPEEIDFDDVMSKAKWVLYFCYCSWEGRKYASLCRIEEAGKDEKE